MKKVLIPILSALLVSALAIYIFKAPLKATLYATITDDMFVYADNDDFDPGPTLGSSFPGVRAGYKGQEISLLAPLCGQKWHSTGRQSFSGLVPLLHEADDPTAATQGRF